MNASVVERAKSGIFPLEHMREYTANYQRAGGKASFSDYYTANYDHAIFKASLRKNIVFAQHNLVSDGTFNEFNVVLCRNVLIYFGTDLQARVHRLLSQSLRRFGILALGRGETLRHTVIEKEYDEIDVQERLYRRRA
jgi:chemotaxis protein methyltransferase CheR